MGAITWTLITGLVAAFSAAAPWMVYADRVVPSLERQPARAPAYPVAALPAIVASVLQFAHTIGFSTGSVRDDVILIAATVGFACSWGPIARGAVYLTGGPIALRDTVPTEETRVRPSSRGNAARRVAFALGVGLFIVTMTTFTRPAVASIWACLDTEQILADAKPPPANPNPIDIAFSYNPPEPGSQYMHDFPMNLDLAASSKSDPMARDQLIAAGFVGAHVRSWIARDSTWIEAEVMEFATPEGAATYQGQVHRYACGYSDEAFEAPMGGIGLQVRYGTGAPYVEQISWIAANRRYKVQISAWARPSNHSRILRIQEVTTATWPGSPVAEEPVATGTVGQQPQLVIENATDQDWVLRAMVDGFAQDIGVPNGGTGTAFLSEGAVSSLVLLNPECQEVGELEWSETSMGVRIDEDGHLTAVEQPMLAGDEVFHDFSECTTGFGPAPSSVGPAVGAPGTIHFLAGEGRGWLIDPATAGITGQAADSGRTNDGEHAISPDGLSVIFSRFSDNLDSSDLFVADLASGSERLLVEDASEPVWSPDGTQIAFIGFDPFTAGPTINVIEVAGGDRLELAEGRSTPRWSPDGTKIAFMHVDQDAGLDLAPVELRIVNVDGTGLVSLADAHPFADEPAWSPDGSRIAFSAGSEKLGRIDAVDVATRASTILAEIAGSDLSSPAWAPDGQSVAFAMSTPLESGRDACVAVVTLTGQLTKYGAQGDTNYASPTWSPDGTWLAAVRTWSASESSDLLVMDLATSEGTVIATGALAITSWRD